MNKWPADDLAPWEAEGHVTDCTKCGNQVYLVYHALDDSWTAHSYAEKPIIAVTPHKDKLQELLQKRKP
jgi:hypothetical protein